MMNTLTISTGNATYTIEDCVIFKNGVKLDIEPFNSFGEAIAHIVKETGATELLVKNDTDRIFSTWHIDDVIEHAKDHDIEITEEQARKILKNIETEHDATIGINWDVISCHIDMYLEDQEK